MTQEIQPEENSMVPGDCSECNGTNVYAEMQTPERGVLTCNSCGYTEEFCVVKLQTFEDLMNQIQGTP